MVKHFPQAIAVSPEVRTESDAVFGVLEPTAEGWYYASAVGAGTGCPNEATMCAGGSRLVIVQSANGQTLLEETFPALTFKERVVGHAPLLSPTGMVLGTFARKKEKATGYRCGARLRKRLVAFRCLLIVGLRARLWARLYRL